MPATETAQKLIADIKTTPNFDAEIKGGALYASAMQLEEEEAYAEAFQAFKDIAKKAPGTKIAVVATGRAQQLMIKGMPGYEKACEKCQKGKKACEKHAKTVKL